MPLLVASLMTMFLSVVVAQIVGVFVPQRFGPELAEPIPPGREFTMEELKRAEQASKERTEQVYEELRTEPLAARLKREKDQGLPVSWIPWVFLPIVYRLKSYRELVPIIAVPLLFAFTPLVLLWELLTYTAACFAGYLLARRYLRAGNQDHNSERSFDR